MLLREDWRAIENEILALLVENGEAVEPKGVAQKIDRSVRLFDDTKERCGIGNSDGATFRATSQVLQQELEMLGEVLGRFQILRHFTRGVAGQHEAIVALSLKENALEDVLAKIDAKDRVSAARHDAACI